MKIFRVLDKIRNRYELWEIYYEYQIGKLIEKLEIQKDDIVVDFGCGNMRFRKYIKGEYIGIDLKEPNMKKGHFIKCDLDEDFPNIKFNKGVLILIMELLKHYDFYIRMISKHIIEGGRLLITIPNFQSEHYKYWKNQDLKKKNPTSLLQNNITMNQLKTELLRNNFKVIEEGGLFAYPFSKGYRYPFFLRFIPTIKDVEMKGRIPINKMSYYYLIAERDKEVPHNELRL
jgi:phage pi2 protein 07